MREPGDDETCPVLGWRGFQNPLELAQAEMPTLEALSVSVPCWGAEGGGGASRLLRALWNELPVVTDPTKTLGSRCPRSLNQINLGSRGSCGVKTELR